MLDLSRPDNITLTFYDRESMPDIERNGLICSSPSAFGRLVICQTDTTEDSFYLVTKKDLSENNISENDVINMAVNSVGKLKPMPLPVMGEGAVAPDMISIGQPDRFNGAIALMAKPNTLSALVGDDKAAYIFPCSQSNFICIITDPDTDFSIQDAAMLYSDFREETGVSDSFADGPVLYDGKSRLFRTFDNRTFSPYLPAFPNTAESMPEGFSHQRQAFDTNDSHSLNGKIPIAR